VKRGLPPYTYRLNRGARQYVEFRRNGVSVMMKEAPGTPEFALAYAKLLNGVMPKPTALSFAALVADYRRSAKWAKLKPRTQADYGKVLDWVTDVLGPLPVAGMRRKDVIRAQAENADRTRFANYIVQVLNVLFDHAMNIGWRDDNPAKGVSLLPTPDNRKRAHVPWTDEAVATMRAQSSGMPRLIFEVGIGTVQRPDDWTRFKWGDYDGDTIALRQGKTGVKLVIPCTEALRMALDTEKARLNPHPARAILTGSKGRPLTYRRMAEIMLAERKRLGLLDYDLHALRYRGVMELALAGCTDDEIASYSGHRTKDMVAKYAGEARQIMLARSARGKRK
jgi:integrase